MKEYLEKLCRLGQEEFYKEVEQKLLRTNYLYNIKKSYEDIID